MCIKMDNQQLNLFNREQLQVFLTSQLGDGCITKTNSNSTYYITNCKFKEYVDFKCLLLGDMFKSKYLIQENGFSKTPIYVMRSKSSSLLQNVKQMSISDIVNQLDDLGVALWFYDDGSLHQKKLFYNLNTHKFSKEVQENVFIPFFNKLGIYPILRTERKKDGRVFYYICIGKYSGAMKISQILSKYPIKCYSYKRWSSETIQKWSKLQEKLKSEGIEITKLNNFQIGKLFKGMITIQDIVRTYKKL